MSQKKLRKLLKTIIVSLVLVSILMPSFNCVISYAAKVINKGDLTETTRRQTVGHKIEGAEYYDEIWDKFRVIAVDNGGGEGEGGGAGDGANATAGNGGYGNSMGGYGGSAAGFGQGVGSTYNQSGTGGSFGSFGAGSGVDASGVAGSGGAGSFGSNSGAGRGYTPNTGIEQNYGAGAGGGTGSSVANALRDLKQEISESRAQALADMIESAQNAQAMAASIAAREKEQESIQRAMKQESIRAKLAEAESRRLQELQAMYETPAYAPAEYSTVPIVPDISQATIAPTANLAEQQVMDLQRLLTQTTTARRHTAVKIEGKNAELRPDLYVPSQPAKEYIESTIAPPEMPTVPVVPETTMRVETERLFVVPQLTPQVIPQPTTVRMIPVDTPDMHIQQTQYVETMPAKVDSPDNYITQTDRRIIEETQIDAPISHMPETDPPVTHETEPQIPDSTDSPANYLDQTVAPTTAPYQDSPDKYITQTISVYVPTIARPVTPEIFIEQTIPTTIPQMEEAGPGNNLDTTAQTQMTEEEGPGQHLEAAETETEEEGPGSKGGNDSEAEQDKAGDAGKEQNKGDAKDSGKGQREESEEHRGKKIFEIDNEGDVGIKEEAVAIHTISPRLIAVLIITLLFIIGVLLLIDRSIDKKDKHNYF